MAKKVLVGCPTSGHKAYCLDEYAKAIKNLTYGNFDALIVDNSETEDYINKIISIGLNAKKIDYCESARDRIINARNLIRTAVLDDGYDYFLSLEQDVIPPKDVIERLLNHEKDIVSGVYFKDFVFRNSTGGIIKKEILPLAYKSIGKDMMKQLNFKDVQGDGLMQVDACGLGCILISKKVLEIIKFRYVKDKKPFDDIWFCRDSKEKGFDIYLDKSVKCKHLIEGMNWNKIKK